MMRFRRTVTAMCSAVLVAACGSTVAGQSAGPDGALNGIGSTGGSGGLAPPPAAGAPSGQPVPVPGAASGNGSGSAAAALPSGNTSTVTNLPSGGSRTTTPIEIGVLFTDTSGFANPAGNSSETSNPYKDDILAYLDEMNKHGGIAGRQLKPVVAAIPFNDSKSFDTSFQAACTDFTQDHHVAVAVYDGVLYNATFNACLTKAGVPLFQMGGTGESSTGDVTDFQNYPGLVAVNSPSLDRRFSSVLNKAIQMGYLTSKNKLGLVVEDCPFDLRALQRVVLPILARNHIATNRFDFDCSTGFADASTHYSYVAQSILQFRQAGVDSVMFVNLYENGLVYYYAQEASAQKWTPQWLLFHSQGNPAAMSAYPKDQLPLMRGFGGEPFLDVTHPAAPSRPQSIVQANCLGVLRAHGISPGDGIDRYYAFETCDATRLMQASLAAVGGQTGLAVIMRGLASLGSSFVSTLTINGATRFSATRHDGMELTRVSVYNRSCSCFDYVGPATPIL